MHSGPSVKSVKPRPAPPQFRGVGLPTHPRMHLPHPDSGCVRVPTDKAPSRRVPVYSGTGKGIMQDFEAYDQKCRDRLAAKDKANEDKKQRAFLASQARDEERARKEAAYLRRQEAMGGGNYSQGHALKRVGHGNTHDYQLNPMLRGRFEDQHGGYQPNMVQYGNQKIPAKMAKDMQRQRAMKKQKGSGCVVM